MKLAYLSACCSSLFPVSKKLHTETLGVPDNLCSLHGESTLKRFRLWLGLRIGVFLFNVSTRRLERRWTLQVDSVRSGPTRGRDRLSGLALSHYPRWDSGSSLACRYLGANDAQR